VTSTDVDAGATRTFSLASGGADNALFTINATTGALAFISARNFEVPTDVGMNNVYDVRVQVSDGTLTDVQDIAVTVTNAILGFTIVGTAGNNAISTTVTVVGQPFASDDADMISGLGGNDSLNGDLGDDTLLGGAGNDTYVVDSAGDQVFETTTTASLIDAGGIDTVESAVSFSLDANAGVRFVENLTLTGMGHTTGTGNGLANRLTGNTGNNLLIGGGGNDRLDGGTGEDTLEGGLGNDTYVVNSVGDVVQGEVAFSSGGGIDTVEVWIDSFVAGTNIELLRMMGGGNLSLTGNDAPGTLVGNEGNNTLNGRGGNDQINGNVGNDTLIGGEGRDTLVGGAGADTFVFTSISNSRAGSANRDVINGFTRIPFDQDRIDLSAIDANTLTPGVNDAFSFIGTAAFATTGSAGQLRLVSLGGANAVIVEADINGDRVADFQIFVNLQTTMLVGDFIL